MVWVGVFIMARAHMEWRHLSQCAAAARARSPRAHIHSQQELRVILSHFLNGLSPLFVFKYWKAKREYTAFDTGKCSADKMCCWLLYGMFDNAFLQLWGMRRRSATGYIAAKSRPNSTYIDINADLFDCNSVGVLMNQKRFIWSSELRHLVSLVLAWLAF